jgi:serine/threonine protein kinase
VVYQGFDPALKRDVAIKVLNRSIIGSARAVERFLREAQVVAGMHHNHIVPVYQLGEHEGRYYIASRLIRGPVLSDDIPEEGLPAERAVGLIVQLLDALAYAHERGVIHRDVKPENVLLDESGHLNLTDFGMAGFLSGAQMTQEGAVLGTPAYMAPEQAQGKQREVGAASDQYSAGVVLYELLTGHQPFEARPLPILIHNVVNTRPPPLTEFRADLDASLQAICLRALAKRPEERFPDCRAMAQALRDWQTASKALPPDPSTKQPVSPPTRLEGRDEVAQVKQDASQPTPVATEFPTTVESPPRPLPAGEKTARENRDEHPREEPVLLRPPPILARPRPAKQSQTNREMDHQARKGRKASEEAPRGEGEHERKALSPKLLIGGGGRGRRGPARCRGAGCGPPQGTV